MSFSMQKTFLSSLGARKTLSGLALTGLLNLAGCGGCETLAPAADAGTSRTVLDGGFILLEDGGTLASDAGSVAALKTLRIAPVDATLNATVAGSETLELDAYFEFNDGTREAPEQSFWASLDPHIGRVNGFGVFTPTRERAGLARIRVRAGEQEAITTVKVILQEDVVLGGSGSIADFTGNISVEAEPNVLYPETETIIPANLGPMLFQWDKKASSAKVELTGALGSLRLFTDGDRVQADRDSWRRFIGVHIGQEITVSIAETDGAGAEIFESNLTLRIADADLTANVYYWAVDRGQIVRIDADSQAPEVLNIPFDNSAAGGSPGGANNNCRACHTLSADGQHMAFSYFSGNGPGGVVDVRDLGAPTLMNRDDRRWNFAALNADGTLLVSNLNKRLSLRSGTTGDVFGGYEDLTEIDVAMPTWSPAGGKIAFAGDIRDENDEPAGWEIDFKKSNLYLLDIGGSTTTPEVGTLVKLVSGGDSALYYPSFSPDGTLLAYTQGVHSRSQININEVPTKLAGTLHIAATRNPIGDGSAPTIELLRANPEANSFFPTFNPQVEGGYRWLAFYSRRDYGHLTRGQERPQIWVAAIDANADPLVALADPSHPAFWLPGQNVDTENLSSFFAPSPCSESSGDCETDSACCGDLLCRPRGDGNNQCVPVEEACLLIDDNCESDADCCESLQCSIPEGTPIGRCDRIPEPAVCAVVFDDCSELPCCEDNGVCLGGICTFLGG